MTWEILLSKDRYEIRIDKENRKIVFEVNSGGFTPKYVTLFLDEEEAKEISNIIYNEIT